MTAWHTIEPQDVGRLQAAIESVVEMQTGYGQEKPDWERVVRDVEELEDHLDLGDSMASPTVQEILRRARAVYRELRENPD